MRRTSAVEISIQLVSAPEIAPASWAAAGAGAPTAYSSGRMSRMSSDLRESCMAGFSSSRSPGQPTCARRAHIGTARYRHWQDVCHETQDWRKPFIYKGNSHFFGPSGEGFRGRKNLRRGRTGKRSYKNVGMASEGSVQSVFLDEALRRPMIRSVMPSCRAEAARLPLFTLRESMISSFSSVSSCTLSPGPDRPSSTLAI